jgi:murein L,D-transpeptidase YcbB/YkuD
LKDKVEVVDPSKINWHKESDLGGYQLRQKPGATNALGLVKFIFPNGYDVYLHDTPSGNLFDRLTRTLSHGCVRVERPAELAGYLLQDQPEWTPELIAEAMHAEKEKRVPLKMPMPIHLLYWTAWTDSEGNLQFRDDVYGYDQKQRELGSGTIPLPAAYAPNVDMHKVGTRIVADASTLHREGGLSD